MRPCGTRLRVCTHAVCASAAARSRQSTGQSRSRLCRCTSPCSRRASQVGRPPPSKQIPPFPPSLSQPPQRLHLRHGSGWVAEIHAHASAHTAQHSYLRGCLPPSLHARPRRAGSRRDDAYLQKVAAYSSAVREQLMDLRWVRALASQAGRQAGMSGSALACLHVTMALIPDIVRLTARIPRALACVHACTLGVACSKPAGPSAA